MRYSTLTRDIISSATHIAVIAPGDNIARVTCGQAGFLYLQRELYKIVEVQEKERTAQEEQKRYEGYLKLKAEFDPEPREEPF